MITIETKNLKVGMYVAYLDRPWEETPFLFQGFLIKNDKQIAKLQQYCKTVQIDEEQCEKSFNVSSLHRIALTPNKPTNSDNTSKATLFKKPLESIFSASPAPVPAFTSHKAFEKEIEVAREMYENTMVSLDKVLHHFNPEKGVSKAEVESCVTSVIDGVIQNPNALALLSTLKSTQQDTVRHSINSCILCLLFGRSIGFDEQQLSELGFSALLHDIGETKVPKEILAKNNRGLTPEEKAQMEQHTLYGYEILSKSPEIPSVAAEVAYSHHERVDGKGYPRNLTGSKIHPFARILAIVNVYEMVTNYPNARVQITPADALKSIYSMRDTFFDGELVEKFIKCLGIYPVGSVVGLNRGEIGIVIAIKPDKTLLPTIMVIKDSTGARCNPPKVVNLDHIKNFNSETGKHKVFIVRVLDPNDFGIDLSDYLVRESDRA